MRKSRKIVPAALLVAAFSLAGNAQGQSVVCGSQEEVKGVVPACAVPATSKLALVALAGLLAAAGAVLLDRRKNP